MIFPFRIETLFKHYPWANWALIATIVLFFFSPAEWYDEETIEAMVLQDWSLSGLLGHMLLHAGFMHMAGNMIVLWVFGNAVCGNTSNWVYWPLFAGLGVAAGAVHMLIDGDPMIGASGAIYGIVGMALAMYPLNRVSVAWWLFMRFGTFQVPLWVCAMVWAILDTIGAVMKTGQVAHLAHLGGLAAGLALGWLSLRKGWVELTEFDNRSLEEIFAGKTSEARRERIRAAERGETAPQPGAAQSGPWAQQSAAAGDPLVMPASQAMVNAWSRRASGTVVSPADAAVIEAGGLDGDRKRFELLYGQAFAAMGYSFHRSLADYFRRVAKEQVWPHEGPALANLLRMIEEDFPAMRACGFVDDDLAWLRDEGRLAAFLRPRVSAGATN